MSIYTVKTRVPIYYKGKRYEKGSRLEIDQGDMDASIFEAAEPVSQKLYAKIDIDTAEVQQLLAEMKEEMAQTGEAGQEPLPPLEEALEEGEPGEPIDLESLTVKDLQEIAEEHGIEGYSRMKKAELIAALEGGGADVGEA